jgi:hypothetical protein
MAWPPVFDLTTVLKDRPTMCWREKIGFPGDNETAIILVPSYLDRKLSRYSKG